MVAPLLQGKNREVPPKVKDLLWGAREEPVKPRLARNIGPPLKPTKGGDSMKAVRTVTHGTRTVMGTEFPVDGDVVPRSNRTMG